MGVTVSGPAVARGVRRREIARKARIALEAIGRPRAELSVVLTGDEDIRRLNREYRGKDTATDVLSFSLVEGEFGDLHDALGDVVISLETARSQAEAYGAPLREEVERLLVHGLLHLVGYDHETSERDARRMRREERRIRDRLAREPASAPRAREAGRARSR